MRHQIKQATVFCLLLLAAGLLSITPASARGGGAANIMASPGYQRALEESRKRYQRAYSQPYVEPYPTYYHRKKKWRHRRYH